jgi:hypothetical protein
MTKRKKDEEIPVVHFAGSTFSMCIELLEELYEEAVEDGIYRDLNEIESEDIPGYSNRVEPECTELKGEVVFPLKCLFDSEMVLFNYCKFYL